MGIVTRHGLHPPNVLAALPRTTPFLALTQPQTLFVTARLVRRPTNPPSRRQAKRNGSGTSRQSQSPGTTIRRQPSTDTFPENLKSP